MDYQKNTHLFDLIKSLSKAEKRYFKIFASKHIIGEQNNYVILFNFIQKMDEYDEDLIFKKFKGATFLNRFPITKKRLYDYVIKALDGFYADSSIDASLYKMIHAAEILYRKSLYAQCFKMLKSAENKAIKHEKFHILIEIQLKYKRLIENTGYTDINPKEVDEILDKDLNYIDAIKHYCELWHVKSKLFQKLNRKGVARCEMDRKEYKAIVSQLDAIDSNTDFDSKYLFQHTKAAYYFAVDDIQKSVVAMHKNIQLFQENKDVIQTEPNVYFSTLTNVIHCHNTLGEYDKAKYYLLLLKALPKQIKNQSNEDLDIKLFSSINSIELSLYNCRGNFSESIALETTIKNGFKLYSNKISKIRRAYLAFNLAVAFFGKEDYQNALKWVNYILNDSNLDEKEDVFCFAQLLNLIVHFELNHHQLLSYAIKNTHRYLRQRDRIYAFESVFVDFINKINKPTSENSKKAILIALFEKLTELRNDAFEKNAFNYFDFAAWAQAKIEGVSYADVVQRIIQSDQSGSNPALEVA